MKHLLITALAASLTLAASAQILLPGDSANLFPEPPASPAAEIGSLGWLFDPDKSVSWISTRGAAEFAYVVRDATGLVVERVDDFTTPFGAGTMFQETANLPEEVWLRVYLSDDTLSVGDPVGAYVVRSVRFGFDRPGIGSQDFDVPEPAHLVLLSAVGLLGFAAYRRLW
jgi:hypothetical protein